LASPYVIRIDWGGAALFSRFRSASTRKGIIVILLDNYIRNTVQASMLVVISMLTTLDVIFSMLDQMADTDEYFSIQNAVTFVLLTTPTTVYEMLPFAALGGALIGLGIISSNNELVVMRSSGVGVYRIVFSILKPTFLIMLFSLILGEFISPPLEQYAQSNKAIQQSGASSISPEQGVWQKIDNEFIHINAIAAGGRELYGVSRYVIDENRQVSLTSFSESASYVELDEGSWELKNVRESIFGGSEIMAQEYLSQNWFVSLSPELLSVLLVDPDEHSISGLYSFAEYFEDQGLDSDVYLMAFWKKLLQPLSTLFLVILASSVVFGPLRQVSVGSRVVCSIGIALIFTIIQRMLEPASLLYGFSPLLAVMTPIIICGALGIYILRLVR